MVITAFIFCGKHENDNTESCDFSACLGNNCGGTGNAQSNIGEMEDRSRSAYIRYFLLGSYRSKAILQTEIEYTSDTFRWRNVVTKDPRVEVAALTAQQFHDENSGGSVNSSQVSFRQLGIKTRKVVQIAILHPPAEITGATTEIPGDTILVKDKNTILFSVCNLYFEAKRMHTDGR